MVNNLEQGFFGIGIQNGKTPENLGVLWRSAQNMGASFIFTIGRRYAKQASDLLKATGAMPYFHYANFDDFYAHLPKGAQLVGVELHERAVPLETFEHPRRCVYLLGAEDNGLTKNAIEKCHLLVQFQSDECINVSAAGTIVMYDRNVKLKGQG